MEFASRFLGMSSYRRKGGSKDDSTSDASYSAKAKNSSAMRSHSYVRFMERYNPRTPRRSLYEKTFGFANSPLKKSSRITKQKGRVLEISRCSSLQQREQYRQLIAQYRFSNLQESSKSFQKAPQTTKFGIKQAVVDLTDRVSPESDPNKNTRKFGVLRKIQQANKQENEHQPFSIARREKAFKIEDYVSPYLSENFIPNMLKNYSRRERQRRIDASAEEKRASLLREKREAKEAMLVEILHEKLKLKDESTTGMPKLPEITEEMDEVINDAFEPYPSHQILSEDFNISITRHHISTLFGLNWLNDEIVNFYMELIVQRSKKSEDIPSVHAMNTFFYPKLCKQGYNSVRRWTKKVDIFAKDMVLYPIHLGVHWCCAVVDFMKKEIRYYDSMGGDNPECLRCLRDYLASEHKNKKGCDYDLSDWKLESKMDIPQQMNGSDCGVFACKFAEYTSIGKEFTFDQSDMPYFRRAMVWEILNKELLR